MKTISRLLTACLLGGLIAPSLYSQNFTFTTAAGGTQGFLDSLNSSAQFSNPADVAVDAAGNLYVADQANDAIRKITPSGTNWIVSTIAGGTQGSLDGTNGSAQFFGPMGITVDAAGNLFVTDQFNSTIRRVTPSGTNWIVTTIAGRVGMAGDLDGTNLDDLFADPTGISVDAADNLFVADSVNNSIRKISPAGTNWIVTTIAGGARGSADGASTNAEFYGPSGVAVDNSGRLFVADQFNNTIRLITPVGTNWVVSTIAGQSVAGRSDGTGTNARFNSPVAVAVDTNDDVYVADLFNSAIRRMTAVGTNWMVATVAGGSVGTNNGAGTNAQFNLPAGLAADAFGDVFVADSRNNSIRLGANAASPPPTGGLQVTITPASAVSAGAGWQLDGGAVQASGTLLSGLVPGNHTISFSSVSGLTTPALQIIPVTARQTAQVTGNYVTAIANAGSLQVLISPAGAVSAGAKWRVDAGAYQTNGAIVAGLSVGAHSVSFVLVPGWTRPANTAVFITNSQTTLAQATYILQTGSLQVSLSPSNAVTAGAQWRVDGGVLQASGATLTGLVVGSHTVSFNTVLGWQTPSNQVVNITYASLASVTATYGQLGSVQVTILPDGAVSAGAQWQVDGGSWQTNGVVVYGLLTGSHTLSFNTISGWITPSNQTVTVAANQTLAASATYISVSNSAAQLTTIFTSGGGFQLILSGPVGNTYIIRASSDLSLWVPISTNTIPAGGSVTVLNLAHPPSDAQFYEAVAASLPGPPQLSGLTISPGSAQFVLNGQTGSNYVVQVSSDLVTWSPLSTNTITSGGSVQITDPAAAAHPSRFYRALLH